MSRSEFTSKLLSRYDGRPRVVREFVARLAVLPECLMDPAVVTAILHGSTARGEFTCVSVNGETQPFSDVEFLIILRRRDAALERRIGERISALERALCPEWNPFFHVDFSFITLPKYRRSPRTLRSFEARCTGIPICGEDVIHDAPLVTLGNLDFGDLNEIVLVRLWNILLYFPSQFLNGRTPAPSELWLSYLLHRNALELATIVLPHLGVLVAGFQKRVEYLESLGFDHALFQYFPQDLPRFLREAWIGKMDPKPYQDNLLLYDKTIRAYLDALRFLSADTSAMDGLGLCQEVRRRHLTLQNQKYLKRNVHELLVLASHISVRRCQWGLRWLTGSRRKTVLCFLLHMHLAAIDYIHGKPEANSHIQLAWSHLDQLYWGCSSTRRYQSSFLNQWRQLRIQFADFASEFFRFYLGKGEYFASILEEQPVPSDLHR